MASGEQLTYFFRTCKSKSHKPAKGMFDLENVTELEMFIKYLV